MFTRQIPRRLLLPVLVLGPLATGQAQTSFDWLNDAATPREAALANAADIAGIPSRRISSSTDSAAGAEIAGNKTDLLLALVQYPANIRQESIRFNVPVGTHGAGLEVRRVAYGTFTSYDEHGQEGSDYSAADLLLRAHFDLAGGELLNFRFAGGYIYSQLSDAAAHASSSDQELAAIKHEKLQIKDEIAKLEAKLKS